jgi:hypothetical protein
LGFVLVWCLLLLDVLAHDGTMEIGAPPQLEAK